MGRPPVGDAGELVVVVPDGWPRERTQSLLALVRWLARELPCPPAVVCWHDGPLVDEFAAVVPTVDAGAVNRGRLARGLAAVGLRPLARAVKSRALRRRLRPLDNVSWVLVGGTGALGAPAWLPGAGARTVVLWCDDPVEDGGTSWSEVAAAAAHFLAAGRRAAALAEVGVAAARVHRVVEPLVALEEPLPAADPRAPVGRVALLGATVDEGTAEVLAALLHGPGAPTGCLEAVWVHETAAPSWSRWADDRFVALNDRVVDWSAARAVARAGDLDAAIVLSEVDPSLAVSLAAAGVPLIDRAGATPCATHAVDAADATRLARLVSSDPSRRAGATAEAADRAREHDVTRVGDLVLRLLGADAP